ncbi:helix-turn-helix domain-containing protein [Paenibacillus hexagrammi]|uniref:AraC family transcriptional regulator n=1 Tax=Paenibacillus hexagrammi TaxID=2908839 RepID=A0ABY3SU05_9BACL|nr:AraC family transcriptional regulator [Paenibacillus sp. YPD9-1]UJF36432.1 AraC family transcriptional regulator [Paenibacillus sp. YPD9-1]
MSEGHYTVLFKRHTGMTLTNYLHHYRIEKAKTLFVQAGLSAKEIAQKVDLQIIFTSVKPSKK